MGQPQGLFTELTRWRDKAAKRGKTCTFTSDIIPEWLNAEIVAAMGAVGHVKAFSFLKQMDDARMAAERRLKRKIKQVLSAFEEKVARAVRQGKDPDYDKLFEELRAAVQPEIAALAVDEAIRTSADVGIVFDPTIINQQAVEWARGYSYELVTGLTNTTRKLVSGVARSFIETPGMTQGDIAKLLAPAFGAVRAEMIATTEVTRAYSEATNETQRLVNQTGLQMTRVWHTANDDIVCPICGPLNGKPESGWRGEFPDGPPAHSNCRCATGLSALGDEYHLAEAAELARERDELLRTLGLAPELVSDFDRLKEALSQAQLNERLSLVEQFVEDHKSAKKEKRRMHGMKSEESMRHLEAGDVQFWYRDTKDGRRAIQRTIRKLAEEQQITPALSSHTRAVYMTSQRNKADAYWARMYKTPAFRSLATGGDGDIVVYGDDSIGAGSLSHEMGHNFGFHKYGDPNPPSTSDYGKVIADFAEPPVSSYAENSNAEDFAEAVEMYIINPSKLERIAPQRYRIIDRLLKDTNYGG